MQCNSCMTPILDMFYYQIDTEVFHQACLLCSSCGKTLHGESTCYRRDRDLICKTDAKRSYTDVSCLICHSALEKHDELVISIEEGIIHVRCFSCQYCYRKIESCETFYLNGSLILCDHHCFLHSFASIYKSNSERITSTDYSCSYEGSTQENKVANCIQSYLLNVGPLTIRHRPIEDCQRLKSDLLGNIFGNCLPHPILFNRRRGRPKKKILTVHEYAPYVARDANQRETMSASSSTLENQVEDISVTNSVRKKRMRSSFKQNQLKILKSYFSGNQNPDGKQLNDIAEKTGLQSRVIQVWFQNSRAKQKKGGWYKTCHIRQH